MEQFKLYNDKITLNYDDKNHKYSVNGDIVYGTTSIINVLNKPALMYWAVNMAIEHLSNNLKPGKALDEIEIKNLLDEAKRAHTIRKVKAGDIGTLVHNWLNDYFRAKMDKIKPPELPVNKEMRAAIKGFFDWAVKNKVKPIASEQKVYSAKHKYAGTFDLEALVNGEETIIDFKSSKAIYPEMFLQAAAYLLAKEEETGKTYKGGVAIVRLSKKEGDTEPFEAQPVDRKEVDRLIKVFLSCLNIYRWQQDLKTKQMKNNN